MQIEIPEEIEASLQHKARDAGFRTVGEYILALVAQDEPVAETSRENWLRKFDAFVARQTSRNPNFDDRRESIYPVR